MPERVVSSGISGDVIELLISRGMTLTSIAEAIGVTKSFLSRVKARSRSLTIDHLVALEAVIGEPLPLLLLHATPMASVPERLRSLYRSTEAVLSANTSNLPGRNGPIRRIKQSLAEKKMGYNHSRQALRENTTGKRRTRTAAA